MRISWKTLLASLILLAVATALGPSEKVLGAALRLVTLHGAWVWTGKVAFGLAALAGLAALLSRRGPWANASLALGRTGLIFWWTYLPMSLMMQQLYWGGLFLDEPRWRVPFSFGVAALLLQLGLTIFRSPSLTSLGNLLFGAALWWQLGGIQNVLHPDSPIFGGGAVRIELFFVLLMGLSLLIMVQIAWLIFHAQKGRLPEPQPSTPPVES